MPSAATRSASWLDEHGPRELELLLGAVVYHPYAPVLIVDNDRHYRDASFGAAKLLGLPRDEIVGRTLDEFADPSIKPEIPKLWSNFLAKGEQTGTLQIVGPGGSPREVEYVAKYNVLPVRHLLVLQDKTAKDALPRSEPSATAAWTQDYALFLMDPDGAIAAWYSGAERIYGYPSDEAVGQPGLFLYPDDTLVAAKVRRELRRTAKEGHSGNEEWGMRKNGQRFWANEITTALRDAEGVLQGFARVVRDFTDRHDRDEKFRRAASSTTSRADGNAIAGIVFGEFDRIPEANDAFLSMVGYSSADAETGRLRWPDLSPPEYFALDEFAHEEALRFGACTPYDKELIHKDGSRVPVRVATAVLQLSPFRWISFVRNLAGTISSNDLAEPRPNSSHFEEIVGASPALRRVLGQVEVVAPTNATVLVLGETGTGKELVARAVHRLSPRRDRPFITLNCAAIPTGLLESELFGYERGAFTGALAQKIGRFELADRGTLFLDEVGDIPLDLQPKLLRALQEKSFERLGGTKTIPIDVRLVAATNRNLTQMMGDKLFRTDLYYRLKVFPITTPPLRDRQEDIPALVRHFTQKYNREMNKQIDKIPPETMRALCRWTWPGNIRELENFIERAVILTQGSSLRAPLVDLRDENRDERAFSGTLAQMEREYVLRVLQETGGVISKAAVRLGMPRTTLNGLMVKLGVSRKDF